MYLEEKNKLFKKMKTQNFSEIVEGSFVQVETSVFDKIESEKKSISSIITKLSRYFSSTFGKLKQSVTLSLKKIIETTNYSRNCVLEAINFIKRENVFLVYKDPKLPLYTFFIKNKKNIEFLEKIEKNEIILELNYSYVEKQIEKKVDILHQKNDIDCQEKNKICQNFDKSYQEIDKECQNFDTAEKVKNLVNSVIKPMKNSYKDNINTDKIIKDKNIEEEKKDTLKKVAFENIKNEPVENVCDDFKNLHFYEEEDLEKKESYESKEKILTTKIEETDKQNKIDVLSNFGLNVSKVKQIEKIVEMPKDLIYDAIEAVRQQESIGKCKSRGGLLINILEKKLEEFIQNPIVQKEIKEKEINIILSEDLKNRLLDFSYKKKIIISPSYHDGIAVSLNGFMDKIENIKFLKELKNIISYEEMEKIRDYIINDCSAFGIMYKHKITPFFDVYKNIENMEEKNTNVNLAQKSKEFIQNLVNGVKNIVPVKDEDFIPI